MKNSKTIPECWEDFSPKQFKYLLRKIFVMMQDNTITSTDVLTDFADYLCGRNYNIRLSKRIDHAMLVKIVAEMLGWIFVENNDEINVDFNVDFNTVQNLIPKYKKLIGPKDAGFDLKFGEYRKACWMYNDYTLNQDVESLDGLVGILYRKQVKNVTKSDFSGDYREKFNEYHIEKYANRVKKWPEYIKWGIYLWFGYFCKYLMSGEFNIEGNEISFASLFQSGDDGKKDENLGMTAVLFTLAESRTFGNINETDNSPLFKIMMKLLADHQTAENLKKQ